ncbi:MAG: glutathione S-transferase [Pseudohongiellaceae bacterium]|jgi:glutathione S-transferase
MRARLALVYAGQQVELREVVLRDKPPQLITCSAKATVPVLQLDGGTVIDESLDIMLWALATSDPQGWLAVDKAQQLALITQSDQNFKSALDRYKYPNRYIADYPEKTEQQIEQTAKAEADIFLQQLERRLQQQPFLIAEHLSLVDMAVLPFIRQFAFVDKEGFDAAPYSKLQQWLANFLTSDLFTQVMPKFKQWQQSDEPLVFTN